jgi:hypothetical protein
MDIKKIPELRRRLLDGDFSGKKLIPSKFSLVEIVFAKIILNQPVVKNYPSVLKEWIMSQEEGRVRFLLVEELVLRS